MGKSESERKRERERESDDDERTRFFIGIRVHSLVVDLQFPHTAMHHLAVPVLAVVPVPDFLLVQHLVTLRLHCCLHEVHVIVVVVMVVMVMVLVLLMGVMPSTVPTHIAIHILVFVIKGRWAKGILMAPNPAQAGDQQVCAGVCPCIVRHLHA